MLDCVCIVFAELLGMRSKKKNLHENVRFQLDWNQQPFTPEAGTFNHSHSE